MKQQHSSETPDNGSSANGRKATGKRTDVIRRKARTLLALLKNGDWQGITERLLRYAARMGLGKAARRQRNLEACEPGIDIICTPHTRFVALRIQLSLQMLGIMPVRIFDALPARYAPRLHIVVCPQMLPRLPLSYIAVQMEQSVSSRWFDQSYINRLENAVAIMDYSLRNIAYLQDTAELSHRQIFYTPISNLPASYLQTETAGEGEAAKRHDTTAYDVAFYGDANTPRRQAFLEALEKHYSVLRVSEVFGEALYAQLAQARVIVNIHYYEGALLETTRLYECLSLGYTVVSESSVDIDEHPMLAPYVTFTPIDDIDAMVTAVGEQLNRPAPATPHALPDDIAHFHFYFARLLVAYDLVDASALDVIPSPLSASCLQQGVGLSLPETHQRRAAFQASYPDFPVFPGLRHEQGWRGCALSYRYLARQARACGFESIEIREDDASLEGDAGKRWQKAVRLFDSRPDLDVLCGLVADVAEDVSVLETLEHEGEHYIVIDSMTSTVCNRYGKKAIQALADWPFADDNVERNTIDRYLEGLSLRVLVPLPFIAQHRADSRSTLWQFQNTTYDSMIEASEQRLMTLACRAKDGQESA